MKRLNLNLDTKTYEAIDQRAKAEGRTLSAFAREAIADKLERKAECLEMAFEEASEVADEWRRIALDTPEKIAEHERKIAEVRKRLRRLALAEKEKP